MRRVAFLLATIAIYEIMVACTSFQEEDTPVTFGVSVNELVLRGRFLPPPCDYQQRDEVDRRQHVIMVEP